MLSVCSFCWGCDACRPFIVASDASTTAATCSSHSLLATRTLRVCMPASLFLSLGLLLVCLFDLATLCRPDLAARPFYACPEPTHVAHNDDLMLPVATCTSRRRGHKGTCHGSPPITVSCSSVIVRAARRLRLPSHCQGNKALQEDAGRVTFEGHYGGKTLRTDERGVSQS